MSISQNQSIGEEPQLDDSSKTLATKTLFNREFRKKVDEIDAHWKSSMIIRMVIIALVVVDGIIISIAPLSAFYLWPSCAAIAVSGSWCLMVIMFRLLMLRPIHPGVHVAWELIIWTGLIAVFTLTTASITRYTPRAWYLWSGYPLPAIGSWGADVFGVVILGVLMILHFYLFVRACINTSRRRSHDIATQAATIAAQMVKNMESRGNFFRRNSDISYGYTPFDSAASGHIIGLENLGGNQNTEMRGTSRYNNNNRDQGYAGFAPLQSSRLSQISHARSGRTGFSQTRTHYSHARSLSVPVPTSPRSLRTALTDEPSFFRLEV